MKYAISFFGLLILIISGVLFFQYQVYSDKLEAGEGDFYYTQEIEITYRSNSLDIRQHFKNLPNQTIDIVWPKNAESPDCSIESETSCSRLSEDKSKFEKGDALSQSLSYIIPLDGGLKSKQLIKDIFVGLSNGKVSYSTVHISTDSEILGQWITGLPLIGQQQLSLVNYALFSGAGPVSEVYWQDGNIKLQKSTDNLSIFSKSALSNELLKGLENLHFLNDKHIAIVQGQNLSSQQGKRILFLGDLTIDSIEKNVIVSQAKSLYDFGDSPKWLSQVVASFITDSEIGGKKSTEIVDTLKNQMTDEQLKEWVERLEKLKGEKVSPKILDEGLSEVFGHHTQYLSLNASIEGIFPFLFNDNRGVYVGTDQIDNVKVVFKDGFVYYTADPLLKHLGYEVSVGKNGYYVRNEASNFRFPKDYGFYVYNETRYNTVSEPVIEIAGSHYVEETWLQRLFAVEIDRSDNAISIKPTATLQQ